MIALGHLTYQEFLAAEYLISIDPVDEIWGRLLDPRWKHTFEFYAGLKRDISTLVALGTKRPVARIVKQRLTELARLAPLTSSDVLDAIKVDSRLEL